MADNNSALGLAILAMGAKGSGGGGSEPSEYLKSASVNGNELTLTKKDDTTVVYEPTVDLSAYRTSADQDVIDAGKQATLTAGENITIVDNVISATDTTYSAGTGISITDGVIANTQTPGTVVSGTNDGTNWSTITIDGTTKNIPAGGGSAGVSSLGGATGVITLGSGLSMSNNELSATGGSSSGAVRYDETQSLTSEQKNTAKGNIGMPHEEVLTPAVYYATNKSVTVSGNVGMFESDESFTDFSKTYTVSISNGVSTETVSGTFVYTYSFYRLDFNKLGVVGVDVMTGTSDKTLRLFADGADGNYTVNIYIPGESQIVDKIEISECNFSVPDIYAIKGTGDYSTIIGRQNSNKTATGVGSLNISENTTNYGDSYSASSGKGSVILGYTNSPYSRLTASGNGSIIISSGSNGAGNITASGGGSIAHGYSASGQINASGAQSIASGSADIGAPLTAAGHWSTARGYSVIANSYYQTAIGKYNVADVTGSAGTYAYIIGNGASNANRANAFTVDWSGNGVFAGTVTPTGADYCEYFEWKDGNPDDEDRMGYLVTLDGNKIVYANPGDDILGITTATKAVIGDAEEMNWSGKYVKDELGRIQYEDYDVVHEEGTENEWIEHVHTKKISPEYDPTIPYEPRSQRQEWYPVGLLGKIYVRFAGELAVGDYISANSGIAVKSIEKTNMRVLEINGDIARVLVK